MKQPLRVAHKLAALGDRPYKTILGEPATDKGFERASLDRWASGEL